MATFRTVDEATAAGYFRGKSIEHKGFKIYSRDVSPGASYGYAFAISVAPADRDIFNPGECAFDNGWDAYNALYEAEFARAEYVSISEERTQGGFVLWYSPDSWDRDVNAARAAIDEFYAAHPHVLAAYEAATAGYSAWRAEVDARQTRKGLESLARMRARKQEADR